MGEKLMGRDFNKMPYKSSILIHSLSSAVIVYAGLLDVYIVRSGFFFLTSLGRVGEGQSSETLSFFLEF